MPSHVVNHNGPMPVTASFTTASTGSATLTVAGSVYTRSRDSLTGIRVLFDGVEVGTCTIWSNTPSTHRAVVPGTFNVTLDQQEPSIGTAPTYSVTLEPLDGGTLSDVNDSFTVVLTD